MMLPKPNFTEIFVTSFGDDSCGLTVYNNQTFLFNCHFQIIQSENIYFLYGQNTSSIFSHNQYTSYTTAWGTLGGRDLVPPEYPTYILYSCLLSLQYNLTMANIQGRNMQLYN